MSNILELQHVSKKFDNELVLDDLCLEVRENTFMTLLGPSGCGKTTTLRIIGGFTTPDQGRVLFEGKDITNLPPNKRQLNTVFQKYALFPHMTVGENIAFGLKISGKSEEYIRDKDKLSLVEHAIAEGHMQYHSQTFDQALLELYKTEQISLETAMNAATNKDDFDLKIRGISGTSDRGWM